MSPKSRGRVSTSDKRTLERHLGSLRHDEVSYLAELKHPDSLRIAELAHPEEMPEYVAEARAHLRAFRRWASAHGDAPNVLDAREVYVPDEPPTLTLDAKDERCILFRADEKWLYPGGQDRDNPPAFPWPGWRAIADFSAGTALREFVDLSTADDVLGFAEEYGPLWACGNHGAHCLWDGDLQPEVWSTVDGSEAVEIQHWWPRREPVSWWLNHVQTLRAVLSSAACLRQEERVRSEDWEVLGYAFTVGLADWFAKEHPQWGSCIDIERRFLAERVNSHLRHYGVGLRLNHGLAVEVETGFGFARSLWIQAAVAVAGGGDPLAVCSACGAPHFRRRAPKTDHDAFCSRAECRKERKRRSRRRRQAAELGRAPSRGS